MVYVSPPNWKLDCPQSSSPSGESGGEFSLSARSAVVKFLSSHSQWAEISMSSLRVDWPRSSSWTFWTQFELDFEPGVQESDSAEYLNPNLLAGSGSSSGQTWTWASNLKPQPQNVVLTTTEINEPWQKWLCPAVRSRRGQWLAHQSDHFDDNDDYNSAPSDFDHYQEDPEFDNGGTGIKEDMVMDQRDWNMPIKKFDDWWLMTGWIESPY